MAWSLGGIGKEGKGSEVSELRRGVSGGQVGDI